MDSIFTTPRQKASSRFLELSYEELKAKNLMLKKEAQTGKDMKKSVMEMMKTEKGLKAVMVCFADLEGKLHMLDYHKDFFLEAYNNLTFDGSSIRGFTPQNDSDLRLTADWGSFRYLPADVFGAGKCLIFANVADKDGSLYESDFRGKLSTFTEQLHKKHGYTVNVAPETEGFLFEGENTEQMFDEKEGFALASKGGYFNVLPQDRLRRFIDRLAEAISALGFENEKDHPEVAPSQFEVNYKYAPILQACDQILIYKLIARQIAKLMGMTACFLPKPIMLANGSGMHTNMSISKGGKNLFYDKSGEYLLSKEAHAFATGILYHANELCLIINSSVNAYRRLDPHYEAPNEIKMSSKDRGSMIRVPIGNEKSARIEVRTVAPDANPYLACYTLLKAGLKGMQGSKKEMEDQSKLHIKPVKKLHATIQSALTAFTRSTFMGEVLGEDSRHKFCQLKKEAADRCPALLGTKVKNGEVHFHHEVVNQVIKSQF